MAIQNAGMSSAESIYNELKQSIFGDKEKPSAALEALCNRVFQKSCDFLEKNRLVVSSNFGSRSAIASMEEFNEDAPVENIDRRDIEELVEIADVPEDQRQFVETTNHIISCNNEIS